MNRNIIFRGKGIKTDVWFYGGYTTEWNDDGEDSFYITDGLDAIPVKKETIGQCTGLKDKNGKSIFEGDILKDIYGEIDVVVYDEYMFSLNKFYDSGYDIPNDAFSEGTNRFEVIGNIYENPELLKE